MSISALSINPPKLLKIMKTIFTLGLVTVLVTSCAQVRPDKFDRAYTKRSQQKVLESRSYHFLPEPSDRISGYTMEMEEQYQRMDV